VHSSTNVRLTTSRPPNRVTARFLAVAVLALPVALSGTSYAQDAAGSAVRLITGKAVKNGSLTGKDIKDRSISDADLKPSVLRRFAPGPAVAAPPGPAGPVGPPGPTGPAGQTGPSGVVQTGGFSGEVGTVGTGGTPTFLPQRAVVTVGTGQRLTGSGAIELGLSSGGPIGSAVGVFLCYSPDGSASNAAPLGGMARPEISTTRASVAVAGTKVPGAGQYEVGICINNDSGAMFDDNGNYNGFVQVTG
jgi:hypothetical protein